MNSLLPELGEYAATEFHPLQRLLRDLHVLVDGVHAGLDLFELFCARTRGMIILAGMMLKNSVTVQKNVEPRPERPKPLYRYGRYNLFPGVRLLSLLQWSKYRGTK